MCKALCKVLDTKGHYITSYQINLCVLFMHPDLLMGTFLGGQRLDPLLRLGTHWCVQQTWRAALSQGKGIFEAGNPNLLSGSSICSQMNKQMNITLDFHPVQSLCRWFTCILTSISEQSLRQIWGNWSSDELGTCLKLETKWQGQNWSPDQP